MDKGVRFNEDNAFGWDMLGNISQGREQLGDMMPVIVYRLLEYSMRDVLGHEYGEEKTAEIFRRAGKLAGTHFAQNLLDTSLDLEDFIGQLYQTLVDLKIGILDVETINEDGSIILTVSEDLDCSGMPVVGEAVCNYDEGFLEGIFGEYRQKEFTAVEIDCWAKGDVICRFHVKEK